jgi:membrane protein implicated in regulation of membrane protease activity
VNLLQLVGPLSDPTIFWLVIGIALLAVSYFVPGPSLAATGFAGIITGLAARIVPFFAAQIILWGLLSVVLSVLFRGIFSSRKQSKALQPATEGRVVLEIPAGGVGRVAYEGTRWRARCQLPDVAIAPNETVRVVGRKRITLIVLPLEGENAAETDTDSDGLELGGEVANEQPDQDTVE